MTSWYEILTNSVSITTQWIVCTHFSNTNSVGKFLSGVDNYLILRRGQFIQPPEQSIGQNAYRRRKECLEEKVQKMFLELLPKDRIYANQWINLRRQNWSSLEEYF